MLFVLNENLHYVDNGIVGENNEQTLSNNGDYYISSGGIHKWDMKGMHADKKVWIKKILFATPELNLEGIPILNLPNETDSLTAEHLEERFKNCDCISAFNDTAIKKDFTAGYNKARQIYKWTDDEVKKIISLAFNKGFEHSRKANSCLTITEDEILQLLSKPKKIAELELREKKKCIYDYTSRCTIDRCNCNAMLETFKNYGIETVIVKNINY